MTDNNYEQDLKYIDEQGVIQYDELGVIYSDDKCEVIELDDDDDDDDLEILSDQEVESMPEESMPEESMPESTPQITSDQASTTIKPVERVPTVKHASGYILFSAARRKFQKTEFPNRSFGEISRMIGNEWRNMSAREKQPWEIKALIRTKKLQATTTLTKSNWMHSFTEFMNAEPVPNQVFQCGWDKCDFQFEDRAEFVDHCISEQHGHMAPYFQWRNSPNLPAIQYTCMWRNCFRKYKQNTSEFCNIKYLIKHIRLMHIIKSAKIVLPHNRKNYVPSKKNQTLHSAPMLCTPIQNEYPSSVRVLDNSDASETNIVESFLENGVIPDTSYAAPNVLQTDDNTVNQPEVYDFDELENYLHNLEAHVKGLEDHFDAKLESQRKEYETQIEGLKSQMENQRAEFQRQLNELSAQISQAHVKEEYVVP